MSVDPKLLASTALVVIDVQKAFDEPSWGRRNNPACETNIERLLASWRRARRPVVFVRHDSVEKASPLRPDRPGNAFKDFVAGTPDLLVAKTVNSAFYGTPDLHGWLRARGLSGLAICGITTNHCCETTARMAGNLGYGVRFVLDATHTFDRGDLTADQLAHATATNLDGEFADVVRTGDVLRS